MNTRNVKSTRRPIRGESRFVDPSQRLAPVRFGDVEAELPLVSGNAARVGDGRGGRLTADEEVMLARAWRDRRCEASRNRLIVANLPLVVFFAKPHMNRGVPMEDLLAEGNLGLVRAAESFDPERGVRFGTYAAHAIRNAFITAFVRNLPRGRLKGTDRRDLSLMERAEAAMFGETGRVPSDSELAEKLGWRSDRIVQLREIAARARAGSLEQGFDRDGSSSERRDEDHAEFDEADASARVRQLLELLSEEERAVVEMRMGLGDKSAMSPQAVAETLDCSPSHVRHVLAAALGKMSPAARAEGR